MAVTKLVKFRPDVLDLNTKVNAMIYDLNNFVLKYQDKEYINIIIDLNKEVQHLDALYSRLKKNEYDNGLVAYREYLGDFLFYLNSGVVPAGIGKKGLMMFLPILENLVQKGQLKSEVLDLFK